VWAADDAIWRDHGAGTVRSDESEDLKFDPGVETHVGAFRELALERVRLHTLGTNDGDHNLRRQLSGRAIVGDGCDGVAAKSPLVPFA
jgi:hypothetical protein